MSPKLLILTLLAISTFGFAKADSIVWAGPVVIDQQVCNGCPYQGPGDLETTTSQSGESGSLTATFGTSAWGPDPSANFTLEIPFTLTTDSLIELNVTAGYSADGGNCLPVGCYPESSWNFSGDFSGFAAIVGGPSVSLAGSGSVAGLCDSGACSAGYFSPGLSLSDTESSSEFLTAGNYLFEISLSGENGSVGDSLASLGLEAVISDSPSSPVPEPYSVGLSGAFAA